MEPAEVLLRCDRFVVVRQPYLLPDGTPRTKDIVRHPGAVAILPFMGADRVCLIRNFRLTAGQSLIEIPAGTLEPGEDPPHAAHRELLEETGYRCGRLEPLGSVFVSPGVIDERIYLFAALDLVEGSPHREPGEQIENLVVPWQQAEQWAHDGTIRDAKTLVALFRGAPWRRVAG